MSESSTDPRGPDPRVQEAVSRLDGLDEREPEDHVEVYEDVHATLAAALAGAQDDDRQDVHDGSASAEDDQPR